jgi:hypothetical protein
MRTGPPPTSGASLPTAFVSLLVHASLIVGGLLMIPDFDPLAEDVTPMMYIPIELVEVSKTTNLAPVMAEARIEEEAVEAKEENTSAETAASAAEDDAVNLDPPPEPPKPPEPKKPEAKPAPAAEESFASQLDDILKSAKDTKPSVPRNTPNTKAANTTTGPPRLGAGDLKRMTASIEQIILSQLIGNGCWADHSDMADARRLKATFRIWFGRGGKFSQAYQLVSPAREPSGDIPLQTFIAHARRALDKCNTIGWHVPEDYFKLPQPQYIDITFIPKVAVQ